MHDASGTCMGRHMLYLRGWKGPLQCSLRGCHANPKLLVTAPLASTGIAKSNMLSHIYQLRLQSATNGVAKRETVQTLKDATKGT